MVGEKPDHSPPPPTCINDVAHARYCDGCLCNVGGQDGLAHAWGGGLKHLQVCWGGVDTQQWQSA
jgi:hypothetical protein